MAGMSFVSPLTTAAMAVLARGCDLHEVLRRDGGLDVGLAAVASPDVVAVGLDPDQVAALLEIPDDVLPRLVAVLPLVDAAVFVDHGAAVHDLDDLELVALGHGEVRRVAGRGDLHGAGTEIHRHVVVGDDGDLLVDERQDHHLADDVLVARVVGVHGHGRIPQHRLGSGRGHADLALAVGVRVADVPEVARLLLELHLEIRDGRVAAGAPVDDVIALVDEPVAPEPDEDLPDGPGKPLVHGEAFPLPVAGAAKPLELVQDDAAVLFLPHPDALDEFLAAQVVPGLPFAGQFLLDDVLRGDPRVVHPGHPEGVVALHAAKAGHDVLKGVVQGVPHVEHPRDIGGRDDDAEGLAVTGVLGMEVIVLEPELVPLRLHILRLVSLGQCIQIHRFPHVICLELFPKARFSALGTQHCNERFFYPVGRLKSRIFQGIKALGRRWKPSSPTVQEPVDPQSDRSRFVGVKPLDVALPPKPGHLPAGVVTGVSLHEFQGLFERQFIPDVTDDIFIPK